MVLELMNDLHSAVQKLIAQPSVLRFEGSMCRWLLLSGKSGFERELSSSTTNHPDVAKVFGKGSESVPGGELDRHVQVKHGMTSAPYSVELVESFLKLIRADFRLSDVAGFSPGPSPQKVTWQRTSLSMTCVAEWSKQRVKRARHVNTAPTPRTMNTTAHVFSVCLTHGSSSQQ